MEILDEAEIDHILSSSPKGKKKTQKNTMVTRTGESKQKKINPERRKNKKD